RDHEIRGERGDDVADDLFLRDAELGGLHAVDLEVQGWRVDVLRNEHVVDAGQCADLCRELRCGGICGGDVSAAYLDVDRRRQTQIQDGIDQSTGLKVRGQLRKLSANAFAHAVHV